MSDNGLPTALECPINWPEVARMILLSRQIDELEMGKLTPEGKILYQFSSSGHELAEVLPGLALDHPHDAAAVYYRSRPFMLASGMTPAEALAAGMARGGLPSDGRDVGVCYSLPRRSRALVLPMSGGVGAQYTPAVGWAQAITYRQRVLREKEWSGAIAIAVGGDGSVATNGFWSALNIATTQKLPLLLLIVDNAFGLSVPSDFQTPNGDIAANLASYGNLRVTSGDGTDPPEAWRLVCEAIAHVRSGEGPGLLRLCVPRIAGHTYVDDQSYKAPEVRADDAGRDPVPRMRGHLMSLGFTEQDWDQLVDAVTAELRDALAEAESWSDPEPEDVQSHLFYGGMAPEQGGLRSEGAAIPLGPNAPEPSGPRINFLDAVRRALTAEMKLNSRILVFGEDVGAKGGVHGATLDMQSEFGTDRVFDTSLSEEGIIGRAAGMAFASLLPVPEIQFRKYAEPAQEQLSDLGTVRWRTGGRFAGPVVVRMPVGFGKTTGDPWHSVTGEAIFAHMTGWRIAFPSNAADAVGLLRTALRGDDPTFFLEHRALLDSSLGRRPYPGDDYCLPFGRAASVTEGDELAVVSWGAMVHRCVEAAERFSGKVAVIDLRTIVPWDQETVLSSVRKTGKVLVVHEDSVTAGFAGEILAVIGDQAFEFLDAPLSRLAVPDIPIAYNRELAAATIPSVEVISQRMADLLRY
jgi:2-oxoisovalerate dehydrogenase E1 component